MLYRVAALGRPIEQTQDGKTKFLPEVLYNFLNLKSTPIHVLINNHIPRVVQLHPASKKVD